MAHADKIKTKGFKNNGSLNKQVFYKHQVDIFLPWPDPLEEELVQDDSSAMEFLKKLRDPQYFINRVCSGIFNDVEFNSLYKFARISGQGLHVYGFIDPVEFRENFPCLQVSVLEP